MHVKHEALRHPVDADAYPKRITVAAANFAQIEGDKGATRAKLLQWMDDAARQGCDLVVFPELALGSWGPSADDYAELADGPSAEMIAERARALGLHVIYGFEERNEHDPGVLHNAASLIGPAGRIGTYRKLHLGIPLETDRFTPGDALPVFDTALGPIAIQICYDFYCGPELSRIAAMKGARLLVNPTGRSALPRARPNLEHATLTRAQENLVFAVSANRTGPGGGLTWAGGSVIGGPAFPGFARTLAQAGPEEELVVATLNYDQLAAWYDWLPWRDWRHGEQRPITELVAREFAALLDEDAPR